MDDEELLAQAEEALTEIKVAQGLSDRQASVLAALRIRLKGSAGKSLEPTRGRAGEGRGRAQDLARRPAEQAEAQTRVALLTGIP